MNISDAFQCLRWGPLSHQWRLEPRGHSQRYATTDSLTRVSHKGRDGLLTPPTPAEFAANIASVIKMTGFDPGKLFDGYFRPLLEAMDKRTRDEFLESVANYKPSNSSGEMEKGPAASVASTGDDPLGQGKPNPGDPVTRKKVADGALGDLIKNRSIGDEWNERLRKQHGQPSLKQP
jgi:hypothetical protein